MISVSSSSPSRKLSPIAARWRVFISLTGFSIPPNTYLDSTWFPAISSIVGAGWCSFPPSELVSPFAGSPVNPEDFPVIILILCLPMILMSSALIPIPERGVLFPWAFFSGPGASPKFKSMLVSWLILILAASETNRLSNIAPSFGPFPLLRAEPRPTTKSIELAPQDPTAP